MAEESVNGLEGWETKEDVEVAEDGGEGGGEAGNTSSKGKSAGDGTEESAGGAQTTLTATTAWPSGRKAYSWSSSLWGKSWSASEATAALSGSKRRVRNWVGGHGRPNGQNLGGQRGVRARVGKVALLAA